VFVQDVCAQLTRYPLSIADITFIVEASL